MFVFLHIIFGSHQLIKSLLILLCLYAQFSLTWEAERRIVMLSVFKSVSRTIITPGVCIL